MNNPAKAPLCLYPARLHQLSNRSAASRLAVGIKDEEQQREGGQYPEPRLQLVRPSSNQLADGIKHEARADSDGDVEGEGHQADHRERGDGFGVVGKIDAREGRKHEQAGNDECRPVGLRRNGCYKRREEERQQETTSSNEDGKPGAPARLYSGGRLEVSAGGGGAQDGSDASRDRGYQHGTLDVRQLSIVVEEAGACRKPDQGAHGIYKRHDEAGEHHRKRAPGEGAAKIKLPQNRSDTRRHADEAMG